MMIYRSGIYVLESKNYSGWIFGSEYAKIWTQTLPSGRKAHKEHFLNPILQNKLHIKWLQEQIGDQMPIHSIVVFSERCTLKQINLFSGTVSVIRRNDLLTTVKEIDSKTGIKLTPQQIDEIYGKLVPFTKATDDVKQRHIENIRKNLSESWDDNNTETEEKVEHSVVDDNEEICPKCGGKLILKTASRGNFSGNRFYGCSNYPKCKYLKNTDGEA